jgi:hypothetical protein
VQALDQAFGGLSPQAQTESVAAAVAELRSCIQLIQQSDRPADHEQLAGVEQALASLAPAEPASPAPPALVLVPAAGGPTPAAGQAQARHRSPPASPALDLATAGPLLMALAAKLDLLHVALSEPRSRRSDVQLARRELRRQVQAVTWLGPERVPAILSVADQAHGLTDRLVAGAALVHLGESRGGEMMVTVLNQTVAAQQPIPPVVATLLRTIDVGGWTEWLGQVFWKPAPAAIGGVLLPVLVEHNAIPADRLWELVNHPRDEIAVEAAHALPWSDAAPDVHALVASARAARTPRRAHALLFAAAVLGAGEALPEIRTRLLAAEAADALLVEALAVSGGSEDADLLLDLAARADDADELVLAAAHLGSVRTLGALPGFADRVPAEVLDEAARLIEGSARVEDAASDRDPAVRYLRGQPWSIAGVLQCLASADESVTAQQRMALELRARTSQAPLTTLPLLLPDEQRPELLSHWATYYAKANGRMKPGGWYYQGR